MQLFATLGPSYPGISCAGLGVQGLTTAPDKIGFTFLKTIEESLPKGKPGSKFYVFSDRDDRTGGNAIEKFLKDNQLGEVLVTTPFINGCYGTSKIKAWIFVPDVQAVTKYMEANKEKFK